MQNFFSGRLIITEISFMGPYFFPKLHMGSFFKCWWVNKLYGKVANSGKSYNKYCINQHFLIAIYLGTDGWKPMVISPGAKNWSLYPGTNWSMCADGEAISACAPVSSLVGKQLQLTHFLSSLASCWQHVRPLIVSSSKITQLAAKSTWSSCCPRHQIPGYAFGESSLFWVSYFC